MAIHVPGWGPISDSSTQTDAGIGTVHADTDAILRGEGGTYQVIAMVGASIASLWDVEHRDAANASNIAVHRVRIVAGETLQFVLWFDIAPNERVRIINQTAFAPGTSEATLQAMRLK